MHTWQEVWRNGLAPSLSMNGLTSLRVALIADDQRLTQQATTVPPPLMCVQDWPVEAACAIGYCGWQGEQLQTVGDVGDFFARCCYEADRLLGEPAACRLFINWFDETPRGEMRCELLAEVERTINERTQANP